MQNNRTHSKRKALTRTAIAIAVSGAIPMMAPQTASAQAEALEEIVVTGIRSSIKRAQDIKRDASGVVDSIAAEDLGKFPDLNVAESLQRIPGVSIDRSAGEGQQVTVRGLGPQFNTVLMNGRQIATDSGGREFNFDVLASEQITGADVYKSGNSTLQEGGIGATINLKTARPLDTPGLQVAGSVKAIYESLSEDTTPAASVLISNTFADDTVGVALAVSHQERNVQTNGIGTAGWRSGQTISNRNDGVLFENAYIPRNWDQIVDQQERTRTNASLVLQYAPSDDLTITLDGFQSKFEVDSLVTDLASWFEPDRVGSGTIDPTTGTLLSFTQGVGLHQGSGDPASDFVSSTRNSRDSTTDGFGLNVDWAINDKLTGTLDVSTSSAENDQAGRNRFNVVGIINSYSFNGNPGGIATVQHDGFENGSLPSEDRTRMHYNEKSGTTNQDEIDQVKLDFVYDMDSDIVQSIKFGAASTSRENSRFQITGSQCAFCGYQVAAPNSTIGLAPFTVENFFPGLIDTFYSYDGDAYIDYLASTGNPIVPTLQNNRFTINEDVTALYADVTFNLAVGEMPLTLNVGGRYAETDIDVTAVQSFVSDVVPTSDLTLFANRFGPATDITESGKYDHFLPNINAKLELNDSMLLRFAAYESLTRPTLSQLSPATTFNEPRRQNLTAQGGNQALEPFESTNFDFGFEWYYGDSNVFSAVYFNKDVGNFITTLTGSETFILADRSAANGFRCADALCAPGALIPGQDFVATTEELIGESEVYTVARPQNGKSAKVDGFEIAITHLFDNGFGISANATFVDSNVSLGSDTTERFALEGLGDSQNLIVFYEADSWQARIAYNNREAFLRQIDNGFNGEPVNTSDFGQVDISASYDINDMLTVFFEGINVTEEELVQTGRFAVQTFNIQDNGSRYAVGIRGKF
ncbi:TonB-dependent receptor [Arenicella xantha]|uniref:TonB-dependent receptor n=1 Tax=Arenicella xantha TaxID=644221 RepID=A0A395JNX9_9GAMM|nr:TonB-dependent receptor [Arenicella xantha]RBP53370.1 TonB-dependent receptor [Arenicella xantha]